MKYKEAVYMVLDKLKLMSDDSDFNELHVIFLLNKYRAYLLKKYYVSIRKSVPDSNYQEICLPLELTDGDDCDITYLRSVDKLPFLLDSGIVSIYPLNNFINDRITLVSQDRLKFTGYNKWLKNIIYCAIGPDYKLWFKSSNPQHKYLQEVKLRAVFEDPQAAYELSCDENNNCDIMEQDFPMEESFAINVIDAVTNSIYQVVFNPEDDINNADSDLGSLYSFIARNMRKQKQNTNSNNDEND